LPYKKKGFILYYENHNQPTGYFNDARHFLLLES